MRRPDPPATSPAPTYRAPDASDTVAYGYTLDRDDRITGFDAAWAAFAAENDAPDLPARVIGTRLREHIGDATTRQLYAMLFADVRRRGRAVRVPFRCDAPGFVREMELEIAPAPDGGLTLTGRLLHWRARTPVALLDPAHARVGEVVRVCGWCKRVELAGAWWELEDAIGATRLLSAEPVPPITHGICPTCAAQVRAAVDGM